MDVETALPLLALLVLLVDAAVFVSLHRPPGLRLWPLLVQMLGVGIAGTFGILISGGVIENGRPVAFALLGAIVLIIASWVPLARDKRKILDARERTGRPYDGSTGPLG